MSDDSSRHQLLQKWASMLSTDEPEPQPQRREKEGEACEYPLVFLCRRCRLPLGDSLSWVAGQEDTNCILLNCQFRPGPRWDRLPA